MVPIENLGPPPRCLQPEDVGLEAHDDSMLLAKIGNLEVMVVKGAKGEIHGNFVDYVPP